MSHIFEKGSSLSSKTSLFQLLPTFDPNSIIICNAGKGLRLQYVDICISGVYEYYSVKIDVVMNFLL